MHATAAVIAAGLLAGCSAAAPGSGAPAAGPPVGPSTGGAVDPGGGLSADSVDSLVASRLAAPYAAAPYVMPHIGRQPDLVALMRLTGIRGFTLSFVVSNGRCSPTWADNGASALGDQALAARIAAVRRAGGDVTVSFGGYGGKKLGEACRNAKATAAAMQRVIDAYQVRSIDFDIEMPEWNNRAALDRETGAAAILQRTAAAAHRPLAVSVTMPFNPRGELYTRAAQVMDSVKRSGLRPTVWSTMVFNEGTRRTNVVSMTQQYMAAFHRLLHQKYPNATNAQVNAATGLVLMNGLTDSGSIYTVSSFQLLTAYAKRSGYSRFTFWELNRDRQCARASNTVQENCSGTGQGLWQFTHTTAAFAR